MGTDPICICEVSPIRKYRVLGCQVPPVFQSQIASDIHVCIRCPGSLLSHCAVPKSTRAGKGALGYSGCSTSCQDIVELLPQLNVPLLVRSPQIVSVIPGFIVKGGAGANNQVLYASISSDDRLV